VNFFCIEWTTRHTTIFLVLTQKPRRTQSARSPTLAGLRVLPTPSAICGTHEMRCDVTRESKKYKFLLLWRAAIFSHSNWKIKFKSFSFKKYKILSFNIQINQALEATGAGVLMTQNCWDFFSFNAEPLNVSLGQFFFMTKRKQGGQMRCRIHHQKIQPKPFFVLMHNINRGKAAHKGVDTSVFFYKKRPK
jgi:hypothetical protein